MSEKRPARGILDTSVALRGKPLYLYWSPHRGRIGLSLDRR